MEWTSLLASSQNLHELQQYPDRNLYRAAALLGSEERPTVPVRLYDDPKKLYDDVLSKFGGAPLSKNNIGVVPFDKSTIYINRKAKDYEDLYRLAAAMAHEQVHASAPKWDRREVPAYERQLAVADRFRMQNQLPLSYRQALAQHIEKLKKSGQK